MRRKPSIGILALGAWNRRSVISALERAGAGAAIVDERASLERLDGLVLPGVANVGFLARELDARGLREDLRGALVAGLPALGICAGYQLLFEGSDEAPGVRGLGAIRGVVRRLRGPKTQHIGWNRVLPVGRGDVDEGWAYFAHAYAPESAVEGALATTVYGGRFTSVVRANNVRGVQFHPERSGAYGARLLRAFVVSCEAVYVG